MSRGLIFNISAARSGVTIALVAPHASHQRLTASPAGRTTVTFRVSMLSVVRCLVIARFATNRILLESLLPPTTGPAHQNFFVIRAASCARDRQKIFNLAGKFFQDLP